MKTEDEYVRKWENHVAGIVALGSDKVRKLAQGDFKTIEEAGEILNGLGDTARSLIRKMYRDLVAGLPIPAANGQAAQPPRKVNP